MTNQPTEISFINTSVGLVQLAPIVYICYNIGTFVVSWDAAETYYVHYIIRVHAYINILSVHLYMYSKITYNYNNNLINI